MRHAILIAVAIASSQMPALGITTARPAPPVVPENAGPGTLRAVLDDYEKQAVSGVQDEEIVTFAAPEHFYQLWLDAIDAAIAADPTSPALPAARLVRVSLLNGVGDFRAAAQELSDIAANAGTGDRRAFWYAQALGSQTFAIASVPVAEQTAEIDAGAELVNLIAANLDPKSVNAATLISAASAASSFARPLDTARLLALDTDLADLADSLRTIDKAVTASAVAPHARDPKRIDRNDLLAAEFRMRVILNHDDRAEEILTLVASDPRSPEARVHALATTNLEAVPSIRESLIELSLLDADDAGAITNMVIARLTATGADAPTAQARKRLWLLLANHRFGGVHGPIARQDVAEQLAAAYAVDDHELRVNVGQQLWRIEQPLRAPLASAMRAAVPTEGDYPTVSSAIGALFETDQLSGPALQYVEGIAQDLTNAHPDLHDKIFHQYEPLIGWPSEDGERLQTAALAAVMGSKPDLATAVQYAQSRPDDNPHVAEAMYRVLHRYHDQDYPGDHPADNTGKDSAAQERAAWIAEYTRRFCFDVSAPHRKKTALRAYIYMLHTYPDSQDALCDAFDHIITSLDEASREYQSAVEYRDGLCD